MPRTPFADHVDLLGLFLSRRQEIVDRIEAGLLNVRDKELSRSRDRRQFDHALTTCFFGLPNLPAPLVRLKGQLAARHLADGFEPVVLDAHTHELDPLELVVRGYAHWERHQWPGRSGRLAQAQNVYAVFMLRQLEHLALRIWDDGIEHASDRLQDVQRLLDTLNHAPVPGAFIRDARWLIQTAQGPLTRQLGPYFRVADHASCSLSPSSRLAFHKAGVRLAGGHLRSQLRYRAKETDRPIDDPDVLAVTRNSNSMDMALLVWDLVPLLEAYATAAAEADLDQRLALADAILQGLSADPELALTRLDLLGPCTMIEDLFVERDDAGRARHTALGTQHLAYLDRYSALLGRLAAPLKADAAAFAPNGRVYSPCGIVYGFVADVLSNMATRNLIARDSPGLSLEDMFESRQALEDKASVARAWAALPKQEGEAEHFEHSPEWAGQMFARLIAALDARVQRPTQPNASDVSGAGLIVTADTPAEDPADAGDRSEPAVSAQEYLLTSDLKRASAGGAFVQPRSRMLADRAEGRFLASVDIDGKWFGVSKTVLTYLTGRGLNAQLAGVPESAIEVLRLMCPALLR